MPKIIVLYILKQVTKTIFFTFLILFGILFFNESIQFLEKAARGDLYPSLLIPVLFFSLPAILEVSVPISVFLGILISIYNLNKTNELSFIYLTLFTLFLNQMKNYLFYQILNLFQISLSSWEKGK